MKILWFLVALLLPVAAHAADSTLAVTAGSGTTVVVSPDGSGNVVPHSIDCDHTTPTNCEHIDSSGNQFVVPQAGTTGGTSEYHLPGGTAASNNSTNVKNAPGNLYNITVLNDGTGSTTVTNYLKLYDASSAPTCSSATGLKHVYPIGAPLNGVSGLSLSLTVSQSYANGIGFCVVGGSADTNNSNAITGLFVELDYK